MQGIDWASYYSHGVFSIELMCMKYPAETDTTVSCNAYLFWDYPDVSVG